MHTLRMRPRVMRTVVLGTVFAVLLVMGLIGSGNASATTLSFATPQSLSAPGSGIGAPDSRAYVSCSSPGTCTAVTDDTLNAAQDYAQQFSAYDETDGVWSGPTPLTFSGLDTIIEGLSCTGPGTCLMVGQYSGYPATSWQMAESGGQWSADSPISLPAAGAGWPTGVSCSSDAYCAVVGTLYVNGQSGYDSMFAQGTVSGVGGFSETAAPNGYTGVACAPLSSDCAAIGTDSTSGYVQNIAAGNLGGIDHVTGTYGGDGGLTEVACPAANQCVAAGETETGTSSSTLTRPYVVSQDGTGAWGRVTALIGYGVFGAWYWGQLSCVGVGDCIVGATGGSPSEGYLATEVDGQWAGFAPAPLPADASDQLSTANGVGCAGARCDLFGWEAQSTTDGSGNPTTAYVPYAGSATFSQPPATKAATSTSVACSGPAGDGSYTCTITVKAAGGGADPTGSVAMTANAGSFAPASCTLGGQGGGSSSCAVTYLPSAGVPATVQAGYSGDGTYDGSTGQTSVTPSGSGSGSGPGSGSGSGSGGGSGPASGGGSTSGSGSGSGSAPGPGSTTTTGAGGGTGATLRFASPTTKTTVNGNTVAVQLSCGAANCSGDVTLSSTGEVPALSAAAEARAKTVVLGRQAYRAKAGAHFAVDVHLNAAGRRTLKAAKGHRVTVDMTITVAGGHTLTRRITLTLAAGKPAAKRENARHRPVVTPRG